MDPIALTIRHSTGKLINPPSIEAILGTLHQLEITFVDDADEPLELAAETTGRLVCKASAAYNGDTILLDSAWSHAEGETTYTLATLASSQQLETLIGNKDDLIIRAQVEWQLPTEDEPRKSRPFDLLLINSPAHSGDGAPDVAGATTSAWLTARSPRIDIAAALDATQRTQLLNNIGNLHQTRLSDDSAYLHIYTPAGTYKGSLRLLDLGQSNL